MRAVPMNLERLYYQIIDSDRGFFREPLFRVLCASSSLYATAIKLREFGYASGLLSGKKLESRVISVGNLTLGGTGKTPMTLWLAAMLKNLGHHPAILSRGYKGKATGLLVVSEGDGPLLSPSEAGDEPVMMAQRLRGIPILTGTNRHASGRYALDRFGADILILDDGYQHLGLKRNCNILLLDHANPFGNGRLFPSGHLREPLTALKRADLICLTRCRKGVDDPELPESVPVVKSCLRLVGLKRFDSGEKLEPLALDGKPVVAFCGIARPDSFGDLISCLGADIKVIRNYPDHHPYSKGDFQSLQEEARHNGCGFILTTEKDAVKAGMFPWKIPLLVALIDLEILEGEERLIRAVIEANPEPPNRASNV